MSLRGACIKLHSLHLDMSRFLPSTLLWLVRNQVRHISFINLHTQHFKMHQAGDSEGASKQNPVIVPINNWIENGDQIEDNVAVKKSRDFGDLVDGAEFDTIFERDEAGRKVSLTLKNSIYGCLLIGWTG
jgi:hypothetical protein